MKLKTYQRLAPYYHKEWTGFVKNYISIIKKLELKSETKKHTVIDIACGTGVLVNELSREGFSVIGVDISEEMISVAKAEFPDLQFDVDDMRSMKSKIAVDLITCTFDSLNYLTSTNEMNIVFQNIYQSLNESGYFLFDINTQKLYEDKQHGTIHRAVDGYEFDQILYYDQEKQISRTIFQFDDGNYEEHIQKPYSYDEIRKIIEDNNFRLIRAFQNSKLDDITIDSYKIFFLVQKLMEKKLGNV